MKKLAYILVVISLLGIFVYSQQSRLSVWYRLTDLPEIPKASGASGVGKSESSLATAAPDNTADTLQAILDIRQMLVNREFAKLNAVLEAYQQAYQQNPANENALFNIYEQAFFFQDSDYGPLLDEWVQSFPDQYQPYLARACYFYRSAWQARGGKYRDETSDSQIEGMKGYFAKANPDIKMTLSKKPDSIVPYYLLLNMHKAVSELDTVRAIVKIALEKCPASFILRESFLLALSPKWGGSYDEMAYWANEYQQALFRNPRLALLPGYIYYDMGIIEKHAQNYGKALELLDKAVEFGKSDLFYGARAGVYEQLEQYGQALDNINMAIDLNAQHRDWYYRRAHILTYQDGLSESLADIARARQLDPNDDDLDTLQDWVADLYYRKARELVDKKDFDSAYTDLNAAIEADPKQIGYYQLMDWLLAKKADWDTIISYWDRYLALYPQDDKAYLERGGAYFHKGDLASAVADAKQAADLGNADGRKAYDRFKSQVPIQE
ncbi:DUF4034 domain-containing protein [Methylovulum psychrotolerans]|uniref:DUF4034 domain-containing protein n=1 Tax=Methylovulum psychrotolerans TaxID=1704499 RepID=UPI001BFF47F0|nr:DUF4034 domain-containing protein [Methylovulum psychrotolerans]